jgi:hypothetical protein
MDGWRPLLLADDLPATCDPEFRAGYEAWLATADPATGVIPFTAADRVLVDEIVAWLEAGGDL